MLLINTLKTLLKNAQYTVKPLCGAASNAEDFTKQFMQDMFGGAPSTNGSGPAAPAPAPVMQPKSILKQQPSAPAASNTNSYQQSSMQQSSSSSTTTFNNSSGAMKQPPPTQPKPLYQQQAPKQTAQPNNEWGKVLDSNVAGAASNAEDFTKQFMQDMFGGSSNGASQAPPPQPKPILKQQPQAAVSNSFQQSSMQQSSSSTSSSFNNSSSSKQQQSRATISASGIAFPDFTQKKFPAQPQQQQQPQQPQAPQVTSAGPGQDLITPRRGRGVLKQPSAGMRIPQCGGCNQQVRWDE